MTDDATPADVRELGRIAGGRYARFAVEQIDRYGGAVPVEVVDSLRVSIPDAIFSTAEFMHARGVEGHLIAAYIDGAFDGRPRQDRKEDLAMDLEQIAQLPRSPGARHHGRRLQARILEHRRRLQHRHRPR